MPEPAPLLGGHKSVGPYAGLVFAALYIVVGVAIPSRLLATAAEATR